MGVVKTFFVLTMRAFDLAVMTRRIGTNELVPDAQASGGLFKTGGNVLFGVGKAIGKLKAVVCLDAFNGNAAPTEPGSRFFKEVGGGVGALFLVGRQEAQAGELVNGGVLKQTQFGIGNTITRDNFHIHLYPLAGVGHLLVGLGDVHLFRLGSRQQFQSPHDTEKGFWPPGVASFA